LLGLTVHHEYKRLKFSIYRKPNSSCHAYEHRSSSINYQRDGLHTYPVTKEAKEIDLNTIEIMLHNNQCNINQMKTPSPTKTKDIY
jgi:hypothetical protein